MKGAKEVRLAYGTLITNLNNAGLDQYVEPVTKLQRGLYPRTESGLHVVYAASRMVSLVTFDRSRRPASLVPTDLAFSNTVGFPLLRRRGGDTEANARIDEVLLMAGIPKEDIPDPIEQLSSRFPVNLGNNETPLGLTVIYHREPFYATIRGVSQ